MTNKNFQVGEQAFFFDGAPPRPCVIKGFEMRHGRQYLRLEINFGEWSGCQEHFDYYVYRTPEELYAAMRDHVIVLEDMAKTVLETGRVD